MFVLEVKFEGDDENDETKSEVGDEKTTTEDKLGRL